MKKPKPKPLSKVWAKDHPFSFGSYARVFLGPSGRLVVDAEVTEPHHVALVSSKMEEFRQWLESQKI